MSGLFSSPSPPNPKKVAEAQTAANKQAGIDTVGVNSINQVDPYGSLKYTVTPGVAQGAPGWLTATETLSPAQQQLLDKQNAISLQTGTIAQNQLNKIAGTMSSPLDLGDYDPQSASAAQAQKYYQDYMAADVDRGRASLEQRLANQGIFPGTEAYKRADREFQLNADQSKAKFLMDYQNQAFNQGMQGRTQSVNEQLTERNQPMQELNAFRTGSQVTQPTFINTPTASVDPAAIGQYKMNNYNQQVAQQNALMGGLGAIGGAAARGIFG